MSAKSSAGYSKHSTHTIHILRLYLPIRHQLPTPLFRLLPRHPPSFNLSSQLHDAFDDLWRQDPACRGPLATRKLEEQSQRGLVTRAVLRRDIQGGQDEAAQRDVVGEPRKVELLRGVTIVHEEETQLWRFVTNHVCFKQRLLTILRVATSVADGWLYTE
jgi:hypothetical protein